jgi:hypothetical protein
MVYNTQNYCFSFTFSILWYSKTKEHNYLYTGSVCVKGQATDLLGPLETINLNHWTTYVKGITTDSYVNVWGWDLSKGIKL